MSARAEYNAGDLVEAVKGERRITDRIVMGGGPIFAEVPYLGEPQIIGPSSVKAYEANGYTLTVIERATPPLPKEVGLYVSTTVPYQSARIVKPAPGGSWVEAMTGEPVRTSLIEEWYRNGTLARLEPAPVTAKRVLERVVDVLYRGGVTQLPNEFGNLGAEFGVQP